MQYFAAVFQRHHMRQTRAIVVDHYLRIAMGAVDVFARRQYHYAARDHTGNLPHVDRGWQRQVD